LGFPIGEADAAAESRRAERTLPQDHVIAQAERPGPRGLREAQGEGSGYPQDEVATTPSGRWACWEGAPSRGSAGLSGDFLGAFGGEALQPASPDSLVRRLERGEFDLVAVGRALLADPT